MNSWNEKRAAVIYARTVCGHQSHYWISSHSHLTPAIRDQMSFCQDYAERVGLDVKAIFADVGYSGVATTWGPGMLGLLQHISNDRCAQFVVIVSNPTRLSRCYERQFALLHAVKATGAEIHAPWGKLGNDDNFAESMKSILNASLSRRRKSTSIVK